MEHLLGTLLTSAPLGVAMIVLILFYVIKVLIQVRDEVRKTNGKVGRQQEWMTQHEKQDDDRFHELREHIRSLKS